MTRLQRSYQKGELDLAGAIVCNKARDTFSAAQGIVMNNSMQSVLTSLGEQDLFDIFRIRHKIFKERLQWSVLSYAELEADEFDILKPVYGLYRDSADIAQGCWRLLPTTGSYMLKDIFPSLLGGQPAPEASTVWEISRFAILPQRQSTVKLSLAALNLVTMSLLKGMYEYCLMTGVSRLVAASDIRFERILKRCQLPIKRFGQVMDIQGTASVGGYLDIDWNDYEKLCDNIDTYQETLTQNKINILEETPGDYVVDQDDEPAVETSFEQWKKMLTAEREIEEVQH